jgi:hypothetical protein
MTSSGPGQAAEPATPESGTQQQAAAIREPQDQTGSPPKFVIEIWASPRLRDQNPSRPFSLDEALGAGRGLAPRREPEPAPEPEAEP